MDIKKLRYFSTIAKTGSYTRAAESLYVSQPALSKAIKQLETELGITLFGKQGNRIFMTDVGQALYESSEKIIREFENVTQSIYDTKNLTHGHVKVGIPPIIGVLYFPSIITSFQKKYPGIKINIIEEGADLVISKTRSEILDLGIGIQHVNCDDLTGSMVYQDEVVALVHENNPLSQKESVSFQDLAKEKFHLLSQEFALYSQINEKCLKAGYLPRISSTSSQWDFIVKMVEMGNGCGVAILPKPILSNIPKNTRIVHFHPTFRWEIMIWQKKDRYTSYANRAFVKEIKESFAKKQSAFTQ